MAAPEALIGEALAPLRGHRLLLGLSGGLDSTVLLHALTQGTASHAVRAIHVNHGLHPDAPAWTARCVALCTAWQVPLVVERVDVDRRSGSGLEAAARAARYAAFAAHLATDEALVLGHHLDDQAETVLLRLLRASSSHGLAAMRARSTFAGGPLLRPLLAVPREALRRYADAQGLAWIEDPGNDDEAMDRNFLRRQVLPLLKQRWPHASCVLGRSAELLAEDALLLAEETARRLETARTESSDTLRLHALLALSPGWRTRVIRAWVAEAGLPPPPSRVMAALETQWQNAQAAGVAWAGVRLHAWRDRLRLTSATASPGGDWEVGWDGLASLALPDGGRLAFRAAAQDQDTPPLQGQFTVRPRRGGERIRLPGRRHSHTLKHCLQDAGLPPWSRQALPLLFDSDGELLAAGDRIISARLAQLCATSGLLLEWRPAGSDTAGN